MADDGNAGMNDHGLVARLGRVERQFAEIQRLAQLGSWEWDIAADVVTWSDELYRIYGVDADEFEATYEAFVGRVHPDDRDMVNETVQAAYAERSSYAFDHRLVRPDGTVRWLHGRGNVIANAAGEPERLYGVAIDITERKRSEQYLREFIANASHEIRTPSSAISKAAHLLATDGLKPADQTMTIEALCRQADRLDALSTNLLDLATLEQGAEAVMLSHVGLADAVRRAESSVPPVPGVSLFVGIEPLVAVLAEPTRLERVFVILLANAVAYGGPNVSVTAVQRNTEVVVEVSDDGSGVPVEYAQSLFAPFAKGRTGGGGSGLGLAIARHLMGVFGGAISYHHAAPHGAVFTLRFSGTT